MHIFRIDAKGGKEDHYVNLDTIIHFVFVAPGSIMCYPLGGGKPLEFVGQEALSLRDELNLLHIKCVAES